MLTSDKPAPAFTHGSTGVFQAQSCLTTLSNLDPASNANADGTITLVLPKLVIGNPAPGQAISSVFGSVRLSPPSVLPGTGGTNETIPDSTGTGSYQLRASNLCLPNTPPLARLNASSETGTVPLTVSFDGSSSVDPDSIDTVAAYTFNFGDGGDDVTQSSPSISHTFTNPGLYPVKLVVTDSRGKVSSNTDQHLITVQSPQASPTPHTNARPEHRRRRHATPTGTPRQHQLPPSANSDADRLTGAQTRCNSVPALIRQMKAVCRRRSSLRVRDQLMARPWCDTPSTMVQPPSVVTIPTPQAR